MFLSHKYLVPYTFIYQGGAFLPLSDNLSEKLVLPSYPSVIDVFSPIRVLPLKELCHLVYLLPQDSKVPPPPLDSMKGGGGKRHCWTFFEQFLELEWPFN